MRLLLRLGSLKRLIRRTAPLALPDAAPVVPSQVTLQPPQIFSADLGGTADHAYQQTVLQLQHENASLKERLEEAETSAATMMAEIAQLRAPRRCADDIFNAADMDGDGMLSHGDFIRCVCRVYGATASAAEDLFSAFGKLSGDTGSNVISREQWRSGFYRWGGKQKSAETQSLSNTVNMILPPPPRSYFSDLMCSGAQRKPDTIPTEERGITIKQLRVVWAHIQRRCVREGWTNIDGELHHTPETVSLYDAARYVILPATEEDQVSFVELMAVAPQPPKWFVSHWWGHPVCHFLRCLEQHAADHRLPDDTSCSCAGLEPATGTTALSLG